jgi:hypothetical protein
VGYEGSGVLFDIIECENYFCIIQEQKVRTNNHIVSCALIILFLVILMPGMGILYAGETETRAVTSFDSIHVTGPITVYLEKGNRESVTVSVQNIGPEKILTETEGLTLRIRPQSGIFSEDSGAKVTVTFRELRDIRVGGGADVEGRSIIQGDKIEVNVNTNAKARLQVRANILDVKLTSTGELDVSGWADSQEAVINTGAHLNAFELNCNNVYIKINTTAVGNVRAKTLIDAEIGTKGTLRYKGNPEKERIKKSLGGTATKLLD